MKGEAIMVGEKWMADQRASDRQFALASLTARIGDTQGQLRAAHLKHRLGTAELLTPDQRQRYGELRGYH